MMEGILRSAAYSHLPCTKMAWQIGDPERCSGRLIRWNARRTMSRYYFFPDFSPATAARRKSLVPDLRTMTALGLQPFLAYQAVIKLWHGGEQRSFDSPSESGGFYQLPVTEEDICCGSTGWRRRGGGRRPPSLWPSGRGLMAGMKAMLAAWKKMVAGGIWMLARSLFFFLLSSLLLGYCSNLFDTIVSLLVRLTPLFFFWRGLMESRFNYNNILVMWAFWEARFALKWIGHRSITNFVAQSDLCSR